MLVGFVRFMDEIISDTAVKPSGDFFAEWRAEVAIEKAAMTR